jgi:hypothetical protein
MIPNTNDGTHATPYLRCDLNYGNLRNLPEYQDVPRGDDRALHEAIKAAGYTGIQDGDPDLCRELGLGVTVGARVNEVGIIGNLARQWQDAGYECGTLHLAYGLEDDDAVDALVDDVLEAVAQTGFPLYIETHRATITQDIYRTVKLVERRPEIRFNADFSHWYTGSEMTNGDIAAKMDFIQPVFDRVRFMHGRIGNPSHIQVDIGDGTNRPHVDHFREFWTRSFRGFLATAQPGDYIVFTPELLPPVIHYAREFPDAQGNLQEESNRWEQAKVLTRIARECFEAATA